MLYYVFSLLFFGFLNVINFFVFTAEDAFALSNSGGTSYFIIQKSGCSPFLKQADKNNVFTSKLEVGKSYKVLKYDQNSVDILIDNVEYSVDISCGQIKQFVPYFTDGDGLSFQPKTPEINDFDKKTLEVCGSWNHTVTKDDFTKLIKTNPDILNEIYEATDKSTNYNSIQSLDEFTQSFIDIWFDAGGFQHILCGSLYDSGECHSTPSTSNNYDTKGSEKNRGPILGGMHYEGRYLWAYNNGYGGIYMDCPMNDADSSVVTVGSEYVNADGTICEKCPNGYTYGLHVKDILISGTKAYKLITKNLPQMNVCYYTEADKNTGKNYLSVFVVKPVMDKKAIVTFYSSEYIPDNQTKNHHCEG